MINYKKNISVFMLLPCFPPDYSGAGKQALQLARQLMGQGVAVTIFTYRRSKRPLWDRVGDLRVIRLPVFGPEMVQTILFNLLSLPLLLIMNRRFQLIHLHSLNGLYCAILLKWLLGKQVIYKMTNCGMDDPQSLRKQPGGRLKFYLFRQVNRVIAISQDCLAAYEKSCLPRSNCLQIPNGVDTQKFTPISAEQKTALREKLQISPEAPVLIFSGNVNPAKGIHRIVSLMIQLKPEFPQLKCFILGPVLDQNYFNGLREQIKSAQLASEIIFTGKVPNVTEYLQSADIFVFPTAGEGLPNALLEAMATGLPCLASRVSGCRDIISHAENGFLFEPADEFALIKLTKRLLFQPELRARFAKKARTWISENYSSELITRRYQDLYENLVTAQVQSSIVPGSGFASLPRSAGEWNALGFRNVTIKNPPKSPFKKGGL